MSDPVRVEPGSPEWKKIRHQAENDLYWFNAHIRKLADPVKMTPRAHIPMCAFVEEKTDIPEIDSAPVKMIQVSRGRGKTGLITQGYVLQQILKNPEMTWGIANEKADNAEAMLGAIKHEFESNELIHAFWPEVIPDFRSDWKSSRITVRRKRKNPLDPSVLATGVGGTVTGVHMDAWVCDDIISQDAAENARSGLFTEIEKINRWCTRLGPLLKDPHQGRRYYICTPWWIGDTYDFLVNEYHGKGHPRQEFMWSVEIPASLDSPAETRQIEVFRQGEIAVFRDPSIDLNGRPVHPEHLDLEALDDERRKNPTWFAAQYLLNPTGGEEVAFDLAALKPYTWTGPHQISFRGDDGKLEFANIRDLQTIISVDPAISRTESSARSAVIVVGTDGRRLFLLEAIAKRVQPTELGAIVIDQYRKYHPRTIIIESVAYQMALKEVIDLLAREYKLTESLPISKFVPSTKIKKTVRILGLEPYFQKGLFYYDPRKHFQFEEELVAFPHHKFRDLLDALSFQKDEWEVLFSMSDTGHGPKHHLREKGRQRAQRIREALYDR